ncbi:MAG: hypothetical protein DHS20C17_06180 [Cyclobacteriaceae bacterium]|nr:MAG: hypothetical protein DHS20C17_06180 [Cyclobacteriaceae bacterium]
MSNPVSPFLISLKHNQDSKGVLGVIDNRNIPFDIARIFWIHQVPDNTERGGHAHKTSEQLVICVEGIIDVTMEEITGKTHQFKLLPGSHGLYLPSLCWGYYNFQDNAIALCLASDYFKESDYIRSYQEFEKLKACR